MRWLTDETRQAILSHRARFKVICAGRRWGKTMLALTWLMDGEVRSQERRWFIAPTYRQGKMIVLPLFREIARRIGAKLNESELTIHLKNGAEISIKGADNEDSLRGAGLDRVIMDEYAFMKPHVWEEIVLPMLATAQGDAMFIGTPSGYNHFYDLYMRSDPQWESWQFKTIEGGFVSEDEIRQARATMDSRLFRQEFEANFETAGNRAAYNFDRELHIKANADKAHIVYVGMDFNCDYMTAVRIYEYTDGTIHYADEIRLSNSNTEEMAKEIKKRWRDVTNIYPDPAGSARSTTSYRSDHQILREYGFQVIARLAHPPQRERLNALNRKLLNTNNKVEMTVDPKCPHLIKDLEMVQRTSDGRIDKKAIELTHALDAATYALEYRFPVRKQIFSESKF